MNPALFSVFREAVARHLDMRAALVRKAMDDNLIAQSQGEIRLRAFEVTLATIDEIGAEMRRAADEATTAGS